MQRYRLTLEYDGALFSGFQSQAGQPTVQDALERAIEAFCGEVVRVAAAGRTDAGVHAAGQVVHFDLAREWPDEVVLNAVNAHLLPAPIAVLDCARVDDAFHARFSAVGRRYLYRILNRPARPALEAGRVWHVKTPLNVAAMDEAARSLEGRHDFTTFRDAACQSASPVKTLDLARVEGVGEEVRLTFEAPSFLHRQVRSMTGSLVQVGLGRWSLAELVAALEARDRTRCGQVAPACGLTLALVRYPPNVAK